MNVAFAIPHAVAETVFLPTDLERLSRLGKVILPPSPDAFQWDLVAGLLAEIDILVTGWRTPPFSESLVAQMPRLAYVANASGAVRGHLPPALWERGIRVSTASSALGWGVAEFALALMLLGTKRAFWLARYVRERGEWREQTDCFGGSFELFGADVGVIGAGQSGRHLLNLLKPFECQKWVYDPFVDETTIQSYGAHKLDTLEELFERCRVVTLHAALTPSTQHLLRGHHFRRMAPGSLFVNTARAGLVHEEELVEVLKEERIVACIDVAPTEPPPPDHPFRHLPNVYLTPHMAGAIRQNRFRMGRLVVDEIERFVAGEPLQHEVASELLSAIA